MPNPSATRTTPLSHAETVIRDPDDIITLVPTIDPHTGEIVYGSVGDATSVGRAENESNILLGPVPGYGLAIGAGPLVPGPLVPGPLSDRAKVISHLPREVMAASWEEIRRAMAEHERGNSSDAPSLLPGGEIVLPKDPNRGQPTSMLPRDVMATTALAPPLTISAADLRDVERLDPDNVEDWTPIYGKHVSGLRFAMSAHPFAERLSPFVFFVFRSSDDGGLWRVAVIHPNKDHAFGHQEHIIRAQVGRQTRAVLCGPGGRACHTLAEARDHAAKWKLYSSYRMLGLDPGFSL